MASRLNFALELRNAGLNAWRDRVGPNCYVRLYDDSAPQPNDPSLPVPGASRLLAEWRGADPFAPGAQLGVLNPTLPSDVVGLVSGNPRWFRIVQQDGVTAAIDGSAAASVDPLDGDMLVKGNVVSGQPIELIALSITDGNTGH